MTLTNLGVGANGRSDPGGDGVGHLGGERLHAILTGGTRTQVMHFTCSHSHIHASHLVFVHTSSHHNNVRWQRIVTFKFKLGATAAWSQRSKPALRASFEPAGRGQRRLARASPEAFQQIDT